MHAFEIGYLFFSVVMICCFLTVPYYVFRSYEELKKMNEKIDRLTARVARDE